MPRVAQGGSLERRSGCNAARTGAVDRSIEIASRAGKKHAAVAAPARRVGAVRFMRIRIACERSRMAR
jgi:hypothetical protein